MSEEVVDIGIERKHELAECELCPLYVRPYIPSEIQDGPVKLTLLLEAGGREEAFQGRPLVGQSGRLLFNHLSQIDIAREDCLIVNAVNCFPPLRGQSHKPTSAEVRYCNPRLADELVRHGADVILAMGATAYEALTGEKVAITTVRGQPFKVTLQDSDGNSRTFTVVPTVHPSFVLRQGSAMNDFVADLNRLEEVLLTGMPKEHQLPTTHVIETPEAFEQYIQLLEKAPKPLEVVADLETGGFNFNDDEILCVSLSSNGRVGVVIAEDLCDKHRALLRRLFQIPGITWTYHFGKGVDVPFLTTWLGFEPPVDDDTLLKSYALDVRRGLHGLKEQARVRLGAPDYDKALKQYLPNKRTSYRVIPRPVLYTYAGYDAAYTRQLSSYYDEHMTQGQKNFYREVLVPANRAFIHAEREGMLLNTALIDDIRARFRPMIESLVEDIRTIAGEPMLNPGSPVQLAKVLFDKLGLPRVKGNSTDKEVLEMLEGRHPIIQPIESYRKLTKFYSTYVEGIADDLWPDSRVRPTYLLHGAVSRTSCVNPPIQTVPRKPAEAPDEYSKELGTLVKQMFIADEAEGWQFGQIDLSQHEFRCIAHVSGDEWLTQAFKEGKDLHAETSTIEGMPKQRFQAKQVNFGILYQRGSYSLGLQMERSPSEAQGFIDAWYARMPKVKAKGEEWKSMALRGDDFINPLGREYNFGLVTNMNQKDVLKQCTNWVPQSTGNDTALIGMATVDQEVDPSKLRVIGFIHDAILFYWRDQNALEQAAKIMAAAPPLALNSGVPWECEVSVGRNWGTLETVAQYRSDGTLVA